MVLLIYPAIQTPAEFLLHLKCLLRKLQGLELLLTRCRRTPCSTGIRPQQLTTSFMHDGNNYGCGRYWYWYRYWYPILTSLMCRLQLWLRFRKTAPCGLMAQIHRLLILTNITLLDSSVIFTSINYYAIPYSTAIKLQYIIFTRVITIKGQ